MTPLGRCASAWVTERKKPSGIRIGAATKAIRMTNFSGSPRSVWSTHSKATRANTSHTPASAWPARIMFCRNGLSRYPGVRRVSIPSDASPPNSTVDTAMSRIAAKIREASDVAQPHVVLLEHLQPVYSQLVDLQLINAQPAYGRIADPQAPDR
jgi:hypothetical protein